MTKTSSQPTTIDGYVADLRRRIRGVADADDVLAEVDDHLRTAAADMVASGQFDEHDAERRAVAEYGPPAQVAVGFRRGARQGGAIPTRFTKLSGLAAMAAPVMLILGSVMNQGPAKGPVHGLGVALQTFSYPMFVVAVAGLIKRHGGLGRLGWTILGLLVVAPVMPIVLSGYGLVLAIFMLAGALALASIGLYRAAILPRPAVLILFSAPAWMLAAALVITLTGGDAGAIYLTPLVPLFVAFEWFGWALWIETPLNR